ncbi:hypothetical protein B0T18DRAFT_473889 [Schizothecium vesticola]|uniref:Uncharacterized protein n=1 Tax=Schizothecium vesticola TaxID=314040 RepID=A0AA40BPH0_9PEZI|nr:hypothetical protein B0T18DRAFT_473889 [Schizothecium vesticola]
MGKCGASDDNGNLPAMAKRRTGDDDDVFCPVCHWNLIETKVPNLHNISHDISHDIMVYQAFASATSALWSAGGGSAIGQIYVTYSFMSLLWAWQFQVAIIAFTLLVFAAKFCTIKSNTDARTRETEARNRETEAQNRETEARNRETASKERIARMQIEMELEKMQTELTCRFLSLQYNAAALRPSAAKPQALLAAREADPGDSMLQNPALATASI